jgi:hypothetical protein
MIFVFFFLSFKWFFIGASFWLIFGVIESFIFGLILLGVTGYGKITTKMYMACLRLKSPENIERYMSFCKKDHRDYCNFVAIRAAERRLKRSSVFYLT